VDSRVSPCSRIGARPRAFGRRARKIAALASLAAAAILGAGPAYADRLSDLRSFGSRLEGSQGEQATFDYITRSLLGMGLVPAESDFSDAVGAYSRSRIVEALVRGAREDELAIVVPVSGWADEPDASEGAYGIALALDEAERLAAKTRAGSAPQISVRFVFLGAEKRGSERDHGVASLGSKLWISRQEGRSGLAVLYLNLPQRPARLAMHSAGPSVLSPYWCYEAFRVALDSSGIDYDIAVNRMLAFRMGLASDSGPVAPYLAAGIPAVELRGEASVGRGGAAAAPAEEETASLAAPRSQWLGSLVDNLARQLSGGFPSTWDRHYFIFQLGRFVLVLREKLYVAFLVCVVALALASLLATSVTRRSSLRRTMKRAPRLVAAIFFMFFALALVFLAGKSVALLESAITGSANAWMLSPRLFAAARIAGSFCLFLALLSFFVEKRILTPNPYFYEFASLVCLALNLFLFSAIDLSSSFYFMWALLLVELSIVLRKRVATLIAFVLMYAPLLLIVAELALRPDLVAYGRLLSPDLVGLVELSAISFPFFVFSASPLLFFSRRGQRARRRAIIIFAGSALALEASAFCLSLELSPGSGPKRHDLSISERIDQDSGRFSLELSGLRALGKGSLYRNGVELGYRSSRDKVLLSGEEGGRSIAIRASTSPFLDRADESVSIDFARPPYSVDISISSDRDILIYDCSLPFKVSVDGRSASIFTVVEPGGELDFSLAVPASFRARLSVSAHYLEPSALYSQSSGSPLEYKGCDVRSSAELAGSGGRLK
jgi:hypothetical protein